MGSTPLKGLQVRMCFSLLALTQVTLPPEHGTGIGSNNHQGADKTGSTNRGEGRDGVNDVYNGLADCELLCDRVAELSTGSSLEAMPTQLRVRAWKQVHWHTVSYGSSWPKI